MRRAKVLDIINGELFIYAGKQLTYNDRLKNSCIGHQYLALVLTSIIENHFPNLNSLEEDPIITDNEEIGDIPVRTLIALCRKSLVVPNEELV